MEGKSILPASVLSVKIKINEDITRISFPITTTFEQLKGEVLAQCGLGTTTKHCLKYEDEEGDLVTLASEADFREALRNVAFTNLLKLTVAKPKRSYTISEPAAALQPSTIELHSSGDVSSKEERKRIKKELRCSRKALRKELKQAKQASTEDSESATDENLVPLKSIEKERKCKQKRGTRHLNTITEPPAPSTPEESATAVVEPTTNAVHSTGDALSKEERKRIKKELQHAKKALREEMKRANHASAEPTKPSKEQKGQKERNSKRGNTIAEPSTESSVPMESVLTAPELTTTAISKEERKRIKELKRAKKALCKEMKCGKQATDEETADSEAEKLIEKERKQKREERAQRKESKRALKTQSEHQKKATESDPSSGSSEDEAAKMATLLQQMEQLGFHDKVKNERVLKRHKGNLESVLALLRTKQQKKVEREAMKAAKQEMKNSKRALKEVEKSKTKGAKTSL